MVLREGDEVQGVRDPTSVGSAFGRSPRSFREVTAVKLRVRADELALPTSPTIAFRFTQLAALFVWTLQGSPDLSRLPLYAERGAPFATASGRSDGAFGFRMLQPVNQLRAAITLLQRDPSTRRAMIVLGNDRDVTRLPRDYPCATSIQFMLRGDGLRTFVHMRSQSVFNLFLYDASLFMLLQRYVAARLGVSPSTYAHIANSLHIYSDELDKAKRVVSSAPPMEVPLPEFSTHASGCSSLLRVADVITGHDMNVLGPTVLDDLESGTLEHFLAATLAYGWLRTGRSTGRNDQLLTGLASTVQSDYGLAAAMEWEGYHSA